MRPHHDRVRPFGGVLLIPVNPGLSGRVIRTFWPQTRFGPVTTTLVQPNGVRKAMPSPNIMSAALR